MQNHECCLPEERKRLANEIRDDLGQDWLDIVLVWSRKLSWLGGQTIQLHAPRPNASLRELAQCCPGLGKYKDEAMALPEEAHGRPRGAERSPKRPRLSPQGLKRPASPKRGASPKRRRGGPKDQPVLTVACEEGDMAKVLAGDYRRASRLINAQ